MFDSGFGGLTVARAVIDLLPHEHLVYIGDTGRYPYGPRPQAEVREFAHQLSAGGGSMLGFMVGGYAARALGASATVATAGLGALSQGDQQFQDAEAHNAGGLQKYMALTEHGYLGYAVIVNKKFWDGLPADIRKQLEDAMEQATRYANQIAKVENDESLEKVKKSGKTAVYVPTKEERQAFKAKHKERMEHRQERREEMREHHAAPPPASRPSRQRPRDRCRWPARRRRAPARRGPR